VAFAENALFKSSGVICWPLPPFSLPGELSMDNGDSNDFFSIRRVCMVSHRSNKTTGSSLVVYSTLADKLLGYLCIIVMKLLTRHCCHSLRVYVTQLHVMCILVVTPGIVYQYACNTDVLRPMHVQTLDMQ
jgi:hypothetical protein